MPRRTRDGAGPCLHARACRPPRRPHACRKLRRGRRSARGKGEHEGRVCVPPWRSHGVTHHLARPRVARTRGDQRCWKGQVRTRARAPKRSSVCVRMSVWGRVHLIIPLSHPPPFPPGPLVLCSGPFFRPKRKKRGKRPRCVHDTRVSVGPLSLPPPPPVLPVTYMPPESIVFH